VRVELDEGEEPPDWREFAGLIVMGGPMGAYEDDAYLWLAREKRIIAEAASRGAPALGRVPGGPSCSRRAWARGCTRARPRRWGCSLWS
jgi:hypothetical protein